MSKDNNNDLISGRFSDIEDNFIRNNYKQMTDSQMAESLQRDKRSITMRRNRLGLTHKKGDRKSKPITSRSSYIESLDEADKRKALEREIRSSARFRVLSKSLTAEEHEQYVEKYVEFMMDPTIETMTTMEKDALHQLIISEIRVNRYLQEEKEDAEKVQNSNMTRVPISRAKEIRECQEVIMKAQKSLNVERNQRLNNMSDQAVTFSNLIKDLKNIKVRTVAGREAAMMKYMAEKYYSENLGTQIISGKDNSYDLKRNFKDDVSPKMIKNLSAKFVPTIGDTLELLEDSDKKKVGKRGEKTKEEEANSDIGSNSDPGA